MKKIIKISLLLISINLCAQDNIELTLLDFNTSYNEIAPYVYQNKLIFCSDIKKEGMITYTTEEGKTLTDLYYVPTVGGDRFKTPREFAIELNSNQFEGPFTFDIDKDRFYYSQNIFAQKSKGNSLRSGNNMTIYYSSIVNDEFRNPVKALRSDDRYNYLCPTMNPEGTLFFYCSNEPGGIGGYDIYVCEVKNGRIGRPANLGKNVNTAGDEIYPFAHTSGRLYFSSEKLPDSRGRFDVYYTYFYQNEWAVPINAGDPFNSKADDYGVYISDDLKTGYFSSNRRRGSFDIYKFRIKYPIFSDCKEIEPSTYCYHFFDRGGANLDTMAFYYEWDLGDGTKIQAESVDHCYTEPGMYFVQLNVIDALTGEVSMNQANYMLDIKDVEQVYINSADTVQVGKEIVFDGLETNIKDFDIDEFYWFMGDGSDVVSTLSKSHVYEKEGVYNVKLGITSAMNEKTEINKACGMKRIVVIKR